MSEERLKALPVTPEVTKSKVFYTTTTDMPHYDALLDPTKIEYYAREKGEKGIIEWMSPDEALVRQSKMRGISVEEEVRGVNQELVSKYSAIMKTGEKMPMPVIDYKRMEQEGRHRILAAKQVGETRIPVLIVEEVQAIPKAEVTPEIAIAPEAVPEVAIEKGQILSIQNPQPWNKMVAGKKVKVYEVRPDGRIAAHFVEKADIAKYTAKIFIFERDELLPKPTETLDLTKGRMIEIPLDPTGRAIPPEAEDLPMSVIEYDLRYTLKELREMARQEGLSASGSKKEIAAGLIARRGVEV